MRFQKAGLCLLTIICLSCLLLSPAGAAEYAPAEKEYAVIGHTSSLNLREGPGYNYSVKASYLEGEWVEVIRFLGEWDQVRVVRTGKTGYMMDAYLTLADGSDPDTGTVVNQSARAFLNLREYPSFDARVLGIYYNGAQCRIITAQNGWYMVEIDGLLGYFKEEFIRRSGGTRSYAYAAASSGKTVNLRAGPSMNEQVLTRVPLGEQLEVYLKGSRFWMVSYRGLMGFMASSYLRDLPSPAEPQPAVPAQAGYGIVTNAGGLNLRQQPSPSARIILAAANGTRVDILKPGLSWCRVRTASGQTGYMQTRYLTVYGVPGTPIGRVDNRGTYVNLRAAPSEQTGQVLAQVPAGQEVTILIPGDEWSQVAWQDLTGYMMTCFIR